MLLTVFALLSFVFSTAFTQGIKIKQEVKVKPAEKEDKTNDKKKKPAKTYELTPVFKKDMKWKEQVTMVISEEKVRPKYTKTKTETLIFKAEVKICEFKDIPTKIKYSILEGKETKNSHYSDGRKDSNREKDMKKKEYEFSVEKDLTIKDIKPANGFIWIYPTGTIVGFAPPTKAVKVGDKWTSTSIIPLNCFVIGDDESLLSNVKSNFELAKVSLNKEKSEIAEINWSGSATFKRSRSTSFKFSWKRKIKFDITNKRVVETSGTIEVIDDDFETFTFEVSQVFKYSDKKEPEKKDEPQKPKSED